MRKFTGAGRFTIPSMAALSVVLLCLGMTFVRRVRAQALPTATAPGAYLAVGGSYAYFKPQYPQASLGGAGVYVDINVRRHIGIEAEGRWLRQGQIGGSNQTTYLIGPRVQIRRGPFSPYVKALVGDGKLVFPYTSGYGNFFVFAGGAGLDVDITRKIKLRLVDFEYQDWPQFNLGFPGSGYPLRPYGVSAGLSYTIYNPGGWHHRHYR